MIARRRRISRAFLRKSDSNTLAWFNLLSEHLFLEDFVLWFFLQKLTTIGFAGRENCLIWIEQLRWTSTWPISGVCATSGRDWRFTIWVRISWIPTELSQHFSLYFLEIKLQILKLFEVDLTEHIFEDFSDWVTSFRRFQELFHQNNHKWLVTEDSVELESSLGEEFLN